MKTLVEKVKFNPLIESGIETEIAINLVKTRFSQYLANELNLLKVVSPLVVFDNTGINDDLNGVEKAITFSISDIPDLKGTIIQSLAKWKRLRLKELNVDVGKGILTDMQALRPDEKLSSIHSIYVDQWDWESIISKENRTLLYMQETVNKIYKSLLQCEEIVCANYPQIEKILPKSIKFIHAQELLDRYPNSNPKEREHRIAQEFGAVFIIGIGGNLSNGEPHDGRAPDYDDWISLDSNGARGLNGDIIVWNPITNSALELSSMGIRVDEHSLIKQLEHRGCAERSNLMFHKALLSGELPLTIGGGIGQSRVCMFMLRKKHIGEVQAGIWSNQTRLSYNQLGINLI